MGYNASNSAAGWNASVISVDINSTGNQTTNLDDEDYDNDDGVRLSPACQLYNFVMYAVVIGLICLLGLVGNILAFVVFCRDKVKTSTSFLFQGLSVIDTMLLVAAFPLYSVTNFLEYTGLSTERETFNVKVHLLPVAFIAQTSTIWVTVLVGFNRYIAVCKPFKAARLCTVVQARRQLTAVLACAVLYNVPKVAEVSTSLGESDLYYIIYSNILYLIFLLILPLLALTVLNIRLINALKEVKRRRAEMQSLRQQQDNNVTLVLIIVVIVFSVCQAPALVNQILWNLLGDEARDCGGFQFFFSRISNALVLANSAVNFPIYVVFNTRFRQVLVAQVGCCRKLASEEYNNLVPNATCAGTKATVLIGGGGGGGDGGGGGGGGVEGSLRKDEIEAVDVKTTAEQTSL